MNNNYDAAKEKSAMCKVVDFRNDFMEDIIALGIIFTINCYVALKMTNVIDGIDIFVHSLTGLQIIALLAGVSLFQLLIELYVRYIYKKESGYKVSRFIMGGFIIFTSYTLCISTGGTSGYDNKISSMSAWDYQILLCVEFIYFCIVVILRKIRNFKSS